MNPHEDGARGTFKSGRQAAVRNRRGWQVSHIPLRYVILHVSQVMPPNMHFQLFLND